MKKKIRDVTCEEFLRWANDRVTDGHWSLETALGVLIDIRKICKACPSDMEKVWQKIKYNHYNLDAEIEISEEKKKHKL